MDLAKSFDKITPNNNRFKVLTDEGFRFFEGIVSSETKEKLIKLTFEDSEFLKCTKDHQLYCTKDFKRRAKRLKIGDYLYSPKCMLKITNIEIVKPERTYDFLEVQPYNAFLLGKSLIKSSQCAYLDEFAFVDNDLEFYASTYPAISSGKDTKIIITSTPNGLNLFYKMWTDSVNAINSKSTFVHYKVRWDEHPERDEAWKTKTIGETSESQFAVEFELSFQGSAGTLIDGRTLETMVYEEPIESPNKYTKVYAAPVQGNKYVTIVDTSEGVGKDYSVINVIDVTKIPYKQVFVYRNNGIVPNRFADVVHGVAKRYNKSVLVVENNNTAGGIVTHILWENLEYDNLLMTRVKDKENETGGGKSVPGIKTTGTSRNKGCSFLKDLIESGQLIISDYETVTELGSFIKRHDKWEAERGKNDDIVMTLVIFSWFTAQNYFEEETGINSNGKLRETLSKDEDFAAMMFFLNDGIEDYDTDADEESLFGRGTTSEVIRKNIGVPPNNYVNNIGNFFLG